jgi:hypothetical protein
VVQFVFGVIRRLPWLTYQGISGERQLGRLIRELGSVVRAWRPARKAVSHKRQGDRSHNGKAPERAWRRFREEDRAL